MKVLQVPAMMSADNGLMPVFRPDITEEEIEAVCSTLRSGWIGAGARVMEFESLFARHACAPHAVAVSTGTAALQAALAVLNVGPGDEVIIPSFTWVSIFQVVIGLGATPVFADVEPEYLTIDPEDVARCITGRTRGIVAVHHGGRLADIDRLRTLAEAHGLWLVDDAAHACGASWQGRPVGNLATMTCFSFNAMKNLSVGDGGMVTTPDADLARQLALYRSLGIDRDTFQRYGLAGDAAETKTPRWAYNVVSAGQRVHMNDITASIGLVQLRRLADLNRKRAALAARFDEQLADVEALAPIRPRPRTLPSHHMYTVRMPFRDAFIERMMKRGVSVGVHYIPIHLFTVAERFRRSLPVTETVWRQVATFPLFPSMTLEQHDYVVAAARAVARELQ